MIADPEVTTHMEPPNLIRERCLIDGAWTGEPETVVTNPASGATIGRIPNLGARARGKPSSRPIARFQAGAASSPRSAPRS